MGTGIHRVRIFRLGSPTARRPIELFGIGPFARARSFSLSTHIKFLMHRISPSFSLVRAARARPDCLDLQRVRLDVAKSLPQKRTANHSIAREYLMRDSNNAREPTGAPSVAYALLQPPLLVYPLHVCTHPPIFFSAFCTESARVHRRPTPIFLDTNISDNAEVPWVAHLLAPLVLAIRLPMRNWPR